MIPSYLSPLANHLWQSTVFAAIVGLLAFAVRKNRASVRYRLWFAASVKFLIPFSAVVSIGCHFHWPNSPAAVPARGSAAFGQVIQPFVMHDPGPLLVSVPQVSSVIPAALFMAWACGFLFTVACCLRAWLGFRAVVRTASPLKLDFDGWPNALRAVSTPILFEPCVFGLFRPVLLLPEGIHDCLSSEEFESVVTHELCHVRRRDNLTAALHMLVEAIFWFYPLLWLVGKRLMDERERACDEEVLVVMSDPEVYARGILNVSRFCVESQLACAAGIGCSNLSKRIEAIMGGLGASRLNIGKKSLLVAAGIAVIGIPAATGLLNAPAIRAQSANDARPQFEVASIKPTRAGTPGPRYNLGGPTVTVESATLKDLVLMAYDVRDFQVSGGPGWINDDRYDIEAKAEGPRIPGQAGRVVQLQRLQNLLKDRFKLQVHRDVKDLPIYELTVAKGGLKIEPIKEGSCLQLDPAHPGPAPGHQFNEYCGFGGYGRGNFEATSITMADFAGTLSLAVNRIVVDKTAVTGMFHIRLTYVPDQFTRQFGDPATDSANSGPSIFTATQEQLGLKLDSSKGPVDVLIIDHVERPTEN